MAPFKETIRSHLFASAETKRTVAEECLDEIVAAAQLITEAFRSGRKLLLCGNGGSAADCQHLAAEFVNRLRKDLERRPLPAIALTTDTSFLTAYANDYNFEGVFARQVAAVGKKGDVLLGISTSGSSANVINAVKEASILELKTIALTGKGGELASLADVGIQVPASSTQFIQEAHLSIEHIICALVEQSLFERKDIPEVR